MAKTRSRTRKKPARRTKTKSPAKKAAARAAGTGARSRARSSQRKADAIETADSAAAPPCSEIAKDLLRFASTLRSNAGEALRFVEDKVQKRLAAPATPRAQTRFVTRAGQLSQQFRDRRADFSLLNGRCLPADPCRPLIDDLDGGGLPRLIAAVAQELADLRSRAMSPLTEEYREQLLHAAHALQRNLTALLDLADTITKAAKEIRDAPVEAGRSGPVLPPLLQSLVEEAEQAASLFFEFLSTRPPSLERSSDETIVGFLSRLLEEKKRLRDETDKFVTVLRKFADGNRASAEAAGHTHLLQFLRDREQIVNRVAARRNTSISITTAAIGNVVRRLSLDETGLNAVDGIVRQLDGIQARLEEQRKLCERWADDAVDERLAEEAASEADLPEWSAIVNAREGDGSKLAGLDMLVAAFREEVGDDGLVFGPATKKETQERLNDLFHAQRPFSDSWVDRRLKDAVGYGIVVSIPRPEGQSRRLPHIFRLSAAAIRKYGPHLPPRDGAGLEYV